MTDTDIDLTSRAGADAGPVYLAGPMFSHAEQQWQREIADTLKLADIDTYLPQRDGIEVAAVMADIGLPFLENPHVLLEVTQFVRKLVFALDIYQLLDRCPAVVLTLDGRVPDDGGVMEAAVAWTTDKPVVLFKTTPITMLGGYDNPMVSGLGMSWAMVTQLDQLADEVTRAMQARPVATGGGRGRGPHVTAVAALGAEVWSRMDAIHEITQLSPKKIPAAVTELRGELRALLEAADLWETSVPEGMQRVL